MFTKKKTIETDNQHKKTMPRQEILSLCLTLPFEFLQIILKKVSK